MPHLRISFQDWQSCLKETDTPLEGFGPQSQVKIQIRCDLHVNHKTTHFSCSKVGHQLNMLLFNVTGGKQKDYVLLDFQENKDLFQKVFILSVGRCGQKYLCKVSTLRLHK